MVLFARTKQGDTRPGRGRCLHKEDVTMQVVLNTRLELSLRLRLDAQVEKEKRPIAQIVAEALGKYLDEKEKNK